MRNCRDLFHAFFNTMLSHIHQLIESLPHPHTVVADSTMLVRGNKAAECAWKRNQIKLPH